MRPNQLKGIEQLLFWSRFPVPTKIWSSQLDFLLPSSSSLNLGHTQWISDINQVILNKFERCTNLRKIFMSPK
jgi:hypothetical protein